jgi:Ca2+/H+ antiporter
MLYVGLWAYTLFLAMIWWFFIIAKIHAYKFKNLWNKIEPITKILLITLAILSILWYIILIYMLKTDNGLYLEWWNSKDFYFNEVNY